MRVSALAKAVPWPVPVAVILAGYAAVAVYGAAAVHQRDLAALRDPVYSSGGMWAWGDEMLAWHIFFLSLGPTFLLLWLLRQYEQTYAVYSKLVFWVSLTAPISLAILFLPDLFPAVKSATGPFGWRIWRAPFLLIVKGLSRAMAPRVVLARRLIQRALLIEGATFVLSFALLMAVGH